MMLEADVVLRLNTDIPIMAHPPDTDSDLDLQEFIDRVIPTDKGIKLDFKSLAALEPAFKIVQASKDKYKQPVWMNADIFQGPNSPKLGINATEFKRLILKYFPESTLSIGWTTAWNNTGQNDVYTQENIETMRDYCKDIVQPVTFPVRAAMVKQSWLVLKSLLDDSLSYTLTIWSAKTDDVDADDMVFVRKNYAIDRIYYDLPEPLMSEFLSRI